MKLISVCMAAFHGGKLHVELPVTNLESIYNKRAVFQFYNIEPVLGK